MNAGVLLNRDEFARRTVDGSGGCPSTVAFEGAARPCTRSYGDTCHFHAVRVSVTKSSRVWASAISYEKARATRRTLNWGRYYNMDQKSTARSLAPNRIFPDADDLRSERRRSCPSGPLASTTGKLDRSRHSSQSTRTRSCSGYATPFARRCTASTCSSCRGRCTTSSRTCPSRAERHGARTAVRSLRRTLPCARFASCQSADASARIAP